MSLSSPNDILLPQVAGSMVRPSRPRLAAFVPIGLALFGVAAILLGGLSARDTRPAAGVVGIDPITTGSVAPPADQSWAMEMLDR